MNMSLYDSPHRRLNLLTNEFVLVSPHRLERPWQGKQETTATDQRPVNDEKCYLCPGNQRANGMCNPKYESTYVFNNDFSALLPDIKASNVDKNNLLTGESVNGICRVVCFSPRHDLTMAEMKLDEICKVIETWTQQYIELNEKFTWVQVFENKGSIMGCSNPHPHGQIWASSFLPAEPSKEDKCQEEYFHKNKSKLLVDYVDLELRLKERIVIENEYWVVIVPFWAVWPYETLLLPKRHVLRFADLCEDEKLDLSKTLKSLLVKYDNLFEVSFPYTMGWHSAPNKDNNIHWQLHAHFYPPLLRSASIKKYLVGYEMLAEQQRDITAEQAALRLKVMSEIHFKAKKEQSLLEIWRTNVHPSK